MFSCCHFRSACGISFPQRVRFRIRVWVRVQMPRAKCARIFGTGARERGREKVREGETVSWVSCELETAADGAGSEAPQFIKANPSLSLCPTVTSCADEQRERRRDREGERGRERETGSGCLFSLNARPWEKNERNAMQKWLYTNIYRYTHTHAYNDNLQFINYI